MAFTNNHFQWCCKDIENGQPRSFRLTQFGEFGTSDSVLGHFTNKKGILGISIFSKIHEFSIHCFFDRLFGKDSQMNLLNAKHSI